MIRLVVEHSPELAEILDLVPEDALAPTLKIGERRYFKAVVKKHYALYKPALSGWGQAPNLDPRQQ